MKILIINLHSSRNAGDAALAIVSTQQLKATFPQATITLSMNDPLSHLETEPVIGSFLTSLMYYQAGQFLGWRWFAMPWLIISSLIAVLSYRLFKRPRFFFVNSNYQTLLQAYFEADIVVSCPGNILQSLGKFGLPMLVSVYAMLYAWLAGKPLYMLPQSIGPLNRGWERLLVRWILAKFRLLMIREPVTYAELIKMKVNLSHCQLIPDMAFVFEGVPRQLAKQFLVNISLEPEINHPLLGVTLINWGAQHRQFLGQVMYEAAVSATIWAFVKRYNGYAIIFPQVWGPTENQDDRVPARRVMAQCADLGDRLKLIEDPVKPEMLKSVYGCMDIFIGTRMHANIFALSEGVPTLAIGYLYKTHGIMQMLHLEEWVVDINQISADNLIAKLEAMWPQREALQEKIQHLMPSITQQVNQSTKLIATDYGRGKFNGTDSCP